MKAHYLSILLFICFSCKAKNKSEQSSERSEVKNATSAINYVVTSVYPHDTTAFTEGLFVHEGKLYESTGSPGDLPRTRSLFGPIDLNTGIINSKAELD